MMLPYPLLGWIDCTVNTAYDWVFSDVLKNVHTDPNGDFTQLANIQKIGALIIGTYDRFTDGDPVTFLKNINDHMPTAKCNKLYFIEKTGHTYQQKQKEVADILLNIVKEWRTQ